MINRYYHLNRVRRTNGGPLDPFTTLNFRLLLSAENRFENDLANEKRTPSPNKRYELIDDDDDRDADNNNTPPRKFVRIFITFSMLVDRCSTV